MQVTYNGIDIQYAEVLSCVSEAVYEDDGIIARGHQVTLTVRGKIRSAGLASIANDAISAQVELMVPRQGLTIAFDGVGTWWDVAATVGGDIDNGPFPLIANVSAIRGNKAADVEFSIRFTLPIEIEGSPRIVSYRYEQKFTIDQNGYARREVAGMVRFSSAFEANPNPDLFRCYVLPIEVAGYQRESLEYFVQRDGLALMFRSVDQQKFRTFPRGIMTMSGTYRVGFKGLTFDRGRAAAGAATQTLNFTLVGDSRLSRVDLLDAAWEVIGSRINITGTGTSIITQLDMTENLVENSVTVACEAVASSKTQLLTLGLLNFMGSLPTTTYGASGRFRPLNPYSTSLVYAAHQAIFDLSQGTPANAAAFPKATTARFADTALVDIDGDGLVDSVCAGSGITSVSVAPSNFPTDGEFQALSGVTTEPVSDIQTGANPYLELTEVTGYAIKSNASFVSLADDTQADVPVEHESPEVLYIIQGRAMRIGTPPVIPTPPQLGTTGYMLRKHVALPEAPKVNPDGRVAYDVSYMWILSVRYRPGSGFAAQTVDGISRRVPTLINSGVPFRTTADLATQTAVATYSATPTLA